MKTLQKIERKKDEITGLVTYIENGVAKGARFDKKWKDDKVLKHFNIEKAEKKSGKNKGESK